MADWRIDPDRIGLASSLAYEAFPAAVFFDNRVVAAYTHGRDHYYGGHPMVTTAGADGKTWSVPQRALATQEEDRLWGIIAMTTKDSRIAVMYQSTTTSFSDRKTFIAVSNTITPWPQPDRTKPINWGTGNGFEFPSHVYWIDNGTADGILIATAYTGLGGIRQVRSFNGGTTWQAATTVLATGQGWAQGWSENSIVQVGNQLVMLIRRDEGTGSGERNIWLCRSNDWGVTWSAPSKVLTDASGMPMLTRMANGDLFIPYRDFATSGYSTWSLALSSNNGSSWVKKQFSTEWMMYGEVIQLPNGNGVLIGSSGNRTNNGDADVWARFLYPTTAPAPVPQPEPPKPPTPAPSPSPSPTPSPTVPVATEGPGIGFNGGHTERYSVWLATDTDKLVREIPYLSGKLDASQFQEIEGGGEITVANAPDANWSRDRLITHYHATNGTETIEYPLMVTLVTNLRENPNGTVTLEVMDKTLVLLDDHVPQTFGARKGANVVELVRDIIHSAGEQRVAIPDHTATVRVARSWLAGTSKLRIANDLLDSISYSAIRVTGEGVFVSGPRSGKVAPVYHFKPGEDAIFSEEVVDERDIIAIPNQIVCISTTDGEETPPMVSVIQNTDPDSEWSIPNRGRVISRTIEMIEAATQEALDRIAAEYFNSSSQVTWNQTVKHLRRKFSVGDDVIGPYGQGATVVSWSQTLSPGALMESTLRRMDRMED